MSLVPRGHDLLGRLSSSHREVRRWRRRAEVEATIAADRIEIARLLAGIASCQLSLAALDQGPAESHPELMGCYEQLSETLNDIFREEMCTFWERTEDWR